MAKKSSKSENVERKASQKAYENFVATWNKSDSKAAVAAELGLSDGMVSSWSHKLRKGGVPLKKFARGSRIDFETLKEIGKKTLKS